MLIVERGGEGAELILVNLQVTACMVMNPAVGCHRLPPGPQQHTHAYHEPSSRLPLLSARPTVTLLGDRGT